MKDDPREEYTDRVAARRQVVAQAEGRDRGVAWGRLAVFAVGLVVAWLVFAERSVVLSVLLVPVGGYISLMVLHERVLRRLARARQAEQLYLDGLTRIAGKWAGKGNAGTRFEDPTHPYAADLDVFGRGSVFELLCTARTGAGEETLAHWLCVPAGSDVVRERQEAIKELRTRLDLKEDLQLLGARVGSAMASDALIRWAGSAVPSRDLGLRLVTLAIAATSTGLTVNWLFFDGSLWWAVAAIVAQRFSLGRIKDRVDALLANAPQAAADLAAIAQVLRRLETETFDSPVLRALQERTQVEGVRGSVEIGRLVRLLDIIEMRRNQLFAPIAWLLSWGTQGAFFLEDWKRRSGARVPQWISTVGEFEALCALSTFAYEHPDYVFPDVVKEGPRVTGTALGHPLIPRESCVRNDVELTTQQQLLLISGSNMSGKSTYLRTVGTNVMLALCGAPVFATSLTLSVVQMGGTLRIQDSLQAGKSRFYAEITRLKQVVDLSRGKRPLLFLLDEILHGTNSHDRRIGAEALLRGLLDHGAVGLCTTHDLALAQAAEALAPRARNVHFEDQMVEGKMVFDHRMRPGVVQRSNALELMRAVGLDV